MVSSSRSSFKLSALALGAAALSLGLTLSLTGCGKNKGTVAFGNLQDGAQVESPFTVQMTAQNLVVEPAANGVTEGHGHFHILVDVPIPMSMDPVPNDAQHIHYGQGQTEAVLDLPEGDHTLTLQFAKGDHRPYDPQISQQIKIHVTHRNVPAVEEGAAGEPGGAGNGSEATVTSGDTTPTAPIIQIAPSGGTMSGSGH